jgi:D-aminopeptidase
MQNEPAHLQTDGPHCTQKELPMKMFKALPAAFALAVSALAAPAALAEPQTLRAAFTFNPQAPAAEIYAGLERIARRACEFSGKRTLKMTQHEAACANEMIADGVAKLGRQDVAATHAANARG